MKKLSYSFAAGMEKVAFGQQKCLKKCLSDVLGVKNRQGFCRKKRSIVNISKQQYDDITKVFARFGVPEEAVWTVVECQK